MSLNIFPAIDLRGGNVVRLTRGDYDVMTTYSGTPSDTARGFVEAGASHLHVVDLDGARDGEPRNREAIRSIASVNGLFIEVGGGIRTEERICDYLSLGVDRLILGSAAVNNFPWLTEMVKKYGSAIAVGVDAKSGLVAINGWEETTALDSMEFCKRLEDIGVSTVIYTDISKDGALSGTNLEAYRALSSNTKLDIVASGGISFEHEIAALRDMGVYGAIVGKAIYEGKLSLSRVLAIAEGEVL